MQKQLENQCVARVSSGSTWHSHQCSRIGKIEREEKFYCKQHDPVAIKEKTDTKNKEWQEKYAMEKENHERKSLMVQYFEGVPTEKIRELIKCQNKRK